MREVSATKIVNATPKRIIDAFIVHDYLNAWWCVSRSLVQPLRGGIYALAWEGEAKGGFQYFSSGIINSYSPEEELIISNFVYVNFERQILGPMELNIRVNAINEMNSKIEVVQSGYQNGGDWDWYYDAVLGAWPYALEQLREFMERK